MLSCVGVGLGAWLRGSAISAGPDAARGAQRLRSVCVLLAGRQVHHIRLEGPFRDHLGCQAHEEGQFLLCVGCVCFRGEGAVAVGVLRGFTACVFLVVVLTIDCEQNWL